jgi:hypothetical protein
VKRQGQQSSHKERVEADVRAKGGTGQVKDQGYSEKDRRDDREHAASKGIRDR